MRSHRWVAFVWYPCNDIYFFPFLLISLCEWFLFSHLVQEGSGKGVEIWSKSSWLWGHCWVSILWLSQPVQRGRDIGASTVRVVLEPHPYSGASQLETFENKYGKWNLNGVKLESVLHCLYVFISEQGLQCCLQHWTKRNPLSAERRAPRAAQMAVLCLWLGLSSCPSVPQWALLSESPVVPWDTVHDSSGR